MAHGFLTPAPVSGESPISKYFERKIDELIGKGIKKLEKGVSDKFNNLFSKRANTTYRSGRGGVEVAGGYGIGENTAVGGGILGGSTTKLLTGSASIVPRKAGIVSTEAKSALFGKNATNINVKEGKYLPTSDPDVAGGPKTSKGKYVNMPGVSAPSGGLKDSNFFSATGELDIEKLRTSDKSVDEQKSIVKDYRANLRAKGVAPTGEAAPPITPDSGIDIVAAVNRNTEAIIALSNLTEEQTKSQQSMHNEQQAHADKLANRALARAEEKQLEKGSDQSGFTKVERFQKLLPGAGGTGGGRGGGPGMGIGGKAATGALVKAVGKRGAQRVGTRLAAKYGGKAAAKTVGKYGAKTAAKVGLGGAAKIGAGAIAKSVGKKIPLVGLGLGAIFAAQRALEGDFVGAGLELASGAASTVPGLGTAGSIGIDAALAARDMGMTPFAKGGIITQPTNALMGEAGKEGVFPLEGSRGKKTFEMFGEGIFEAQKDAKDEFAKVQAAGLKFYFQNQNGFKFFGNLLKTVFAPFLEPLKALGNLKNAGGGLLNYLFGLGDNDTKNKRGGVNGRSRMVGPPPPVTGTGDLFDVIASGEGGYESINRGVAGDTPGGAKSVFAKNLSDMTVGEVMDLQAQDKLFAVGKYQIIPKTMKGFVRTMKIDMNDKFDSTTQEKFKKYVIDFKRPAVGKYLRGETNDRAEAAQELAREFASIGLAYNEAGRVRGESRYSGRAGNAASISPEEIEAALDRGRNNQIPEYDPSAKYKTGDLVIKNGQVRQFDGMGWAAADGVSAQNLGPQAQASNPNTGTPIMATSAQVARAGSTASSPTIINNYYTTANSSGGGVNSNGVAAGIGMNDTGTAAFTELRLRTLA